MATITSMEKLQMDSIGAKPPRQMGKAKIVFLEPVMVLHTPSLEQAWPVRPMGDDADKFQLECRINDESNASFKSAMNAFDARVRELGVKNQKSWFNIGDKDEPMDDKDLKRLYNASIKRGNEKPDGSRYDDTIKFKVTGWKDYVDEIVYRGEGDKKFAVDIKWNSRFVGSHKNTGPADNETKFYICEGVNMATGKQKMAEMTPCQDPAGNEIKDAKGNTVWEYVGPKHCQPGCKLTVVFQPSMVWLASKFGVTITAKQVFITPAPPKARAVLDGIEIVDVVDPVLASKAARAALASDEIRDLDAVAEAIIANDASPEAEDDDIHSGQKRTTQEADLETSPKKDSKELPKKKKSKTVTVDESF